MKTQSNLKIDFKLLSRLWPYLKPQKIRFFIALALLPLAMLLNLIQPWLIKKAVDENIAHSQLDGLEIIALFLLSAVILAYLTEALYSYLLAYTGQHTLLELRKACYQKVLGFHPAYFERNPAGKILTRLTSDIEAIGETIGPGVVSIFLDLLLIIGVLIAMFSLEWKMTLLLLTLSPLLLGGLSLCRNKLRQYFDAIRENLANLNAYLTERLNGIEVVQLFNNYKQSFDRFDEKNRKFRDAAVRANIFDALIYSIVDGTSAISISMMLYYASSSLGSDVSIGTLTAFIFYIQRLFRPLQEFSGKIAIIQRATTALEKVFSLLDTEEQASQGKIPLSKFNGKIEIKDLSFSYPGRNVDVLKHVSFTIEPGEVVALVGPSGSGKTTLIRILTKTYDNYRGSIKLDGTELREIKLDDLRKHLICVPQDIQIFPETIRFNVTLGNPKITEEDLARAAKISKLDELLRKLPEGWETKLSNRGANISQGQAQLITFARAMAHNPSMIILDEATASIDPHTEQLIQSALQEIFQRKTTLVVAHRLSTITSADKIVVLQRGKIAEIGTHSELLSRKGLYASLYQSGLWE